jgi:anti-sigma regulatory factor (Ser/Thr protein kinase)
MAAIDSAERTRIDQRALAAQTSEAGCQWLVPVIEMAAPASRQWGWHPDSEPIRWTCFPGAARRTPGMNATLVHGARHFTMATLARWGVTERCDDIVIVVCELLTNAIRHALPGPGGTQATEAIRLGLVQPGNCVICAVADPSPALPVARQPDDGAETGRGLHVITALSDHWGYSTPGDSGKVLWATFSATIRCTA